MEEKLTFCGLCDGGCFVKAQVEDNEIKRVLPAGGGSRPCVKSAALKTYVHHPERVRQPLRRTGEKGSGQFEPISWDEAFEEIGSRLRKVREESGAKSVAVFTGHPKWFRALLAEFAAEYGTPNVCTESSTCHNAPEIAYHLNYGCGVLPPDFKNCRTVICWGVNPAYSSVNNAVAMFGVRERGGRLIVVDPRKTPASERADLHLQIRPGTDGALALAMAHVILKEGLEDKEYLEHNALGLEEYRAYVETFPPERAAEICGVEAESIVTAARWFAADGPAAIYTSSCGIAHTPNGVQNLRAVYLLEGLTGNFNREGGNCRGGGPGVKLNGFHHDARSRVNVEEEFNQGRFPVWNRLVPNECQSLDLDKAILTGQPYPIRVLLGFGMNHRMFPQSERMRRALLECEFFVAVDPFLTDTAKCADLVLPCQLSPEREYVFLRPGGRVTYLPAAVESGECLSDVEIILGLCRQLDLKGPLTGMGGQDEYLNWMLEPTGVTLAEVKACPEGVPIRNTRRGSGAGHGLNTPSGKVEFRSLLLEEYSEMDGYDPLPVYRDCRDQNPSREQFPVLLCAGGRRAWYFQSRSYRIGWLAGLEKHPLVTVNAEDARIWQIKDGDRVRVITPKGEKEFFAEVSPAIRRGEVYVLNDHPEQDINSIIDADYRDPISGFPGFRTYFCRVEVLK